MLRTLCKTSLLFLLVSSVGCLGTAPPPDPGASPADAGAPTASLPGDATGTAGGPSNTFNHDQTQADPFTILARIQQEGPPEVSTRLHSCQKIKFATLGNILSGLGVNLQAQAAMGMPPTAGQLYLGGAQAMGSPNYGARVREAIELTAASATKIFDIFTQASPEIIAAVAAGSVCKKGGQPIKLFDSNGKFTLDGLSCLTGAPATQAQADIANEALTEASSAQLGQQIAVATVLAAAHTCE